MPAVTPPGPEVHVYTPGELNREVRLHLEAGFPRLWVAGEISNLARPASGHWYFTLKDEKGQIRCALFKGQTLGVGFRPANGDRVLVRGRLSLYEPRGDYQLIGDAMLEAGAGALQQAFEALKKKLEKEGLFASENKKPLPPFPGRIAVVTSPTGAAVRDVVETLRLRWPAARVRIYPAQVQGEAAPASLIRALAAAQRHGFAQVILLVRGGGSLEDLWAFNDEGLARVIHGLTIPVISGVGHETDITIADLVADYRAATPTAAAQAATPDGPALQRQAGRLTERLIRSQAAALQRSAQRLDFVHRRLQARHPARRLAELQQRHSELDRRLRGAAARILQEQGRRLVGLTIRLQGRHPGRELERQREQLAARRARLKRAIRRRLERANARLGELGRALNAISPLAVLGRGYGLVQDPGGRVLSHRKDFKKGMDINVLIRDFKVVSRVRSVADSDFGEGKPETGSRKPG